MSMLKIEKLRIKDQLGFFLIFQLGYVYLRCFRERHLNNFKKHNILRYIYYFFIIILISVLIIYTGRYSNYDKNIYIYICANFV